MEPWPDRRFDGRYCDECREMSNHTGDMHRAAVADIEDAEGVDDRWAVRHDAYRDGPDL